MSATANWSYTAQATIWKQTGATNDYGDPVFAAPLVIACDYQGGLSKRLGDIGGERVVKQTIWTEYALADSGDYVLIGSSDNPNPIAAGADEVMQVVQYADTFERTADDFAILTGA